MSNSNGSTALTERDRKLAAEYEAVCEAYYAFPVRLEREIGFGGISALAEHLFGGNVDYNPPVDLARYLAARGAWDALKPLLRPLLLLIMRQGMNTAEAWDIVMRIPGEWLVANIEPVAEALLLDEHDAGAWNAVLTLFDRIDKTLARRLALRAYQHGESTIHALGNRYLARQ